LDYAKTDIDQSNHFYIQLSQCYDTRQTTVAASEW